MMHKPIQFKNLALSFPHKTCFSEFHGQILYGSRIAVIGRNGCGKSSLLNMLRGMVEPADGEISLPDPSRIGYVPQQMDAFGSLSGGQRLNRALTQALSVHPDLLLLDEPTNHLDKKNRRSLLRLLHAFKGTLIVVTHDVELLRNTIDTIWHIDNGKITVFSGNYDDYQREKAIRHASLQQNISQLVAQKRENHQALMKEQERARNSRIKGEKHIQQRKWPTVRSATKVTNAVETSGRKQRALHDRKEAVSRQLTECRLPEVIKPGFSLPGRESNRLLVAVGQGELAFSGGAAVLTDIHLHIHSRERIAIVGDNGSGKSCLLKAIYGGRDVQKTGEWSVTGSVGYLDQHYDTLSGDTVMDVISQAMPKATYLEIRRHLNDFLFRKNEEVDALISTLSGGEKARLSLAVIAAKTPDLLLLDEITNNLDLETRNHMIEVLREYPGAMMVVSHDYYFLKSINISQCFHVQNGRINLTSELEEYYD
ncbi:ABC-F family ATP-binding cassette domain-containing protein [Legionella sp. CNM-4043-24]|uniref:ABC-F family ATP-binding cassette domain-containing protein n=1 Tax=Legionella sp. CNM-4043-24 TaxID=3421646 RepID=UPI00403B2314